MISIWSETVSVLWLVKTGRTLRSDWLRVASVLCTVDTGLQAGCTKSQSDSNTHTPSPAREKTDKTQNITKCSKATPHWSSQSQGLIPPHKMICSHSDEALYKKYHPGPGNYDPVARVSRLQPAGGSAALHRQPGPDTGDCWGLNPLQITSHDTGEREREGIG